MKNDLLKILFLCFLISCNKSAPQNMGNGVGNSSTFNCTGLSISFSKDVNPIIQSTCATGSNCHEAGSDNGPGELLNYAEIERAAIQIRAAVVSGEMPKTGSLTASQKTDIICWIDNGAANN